MSYQRSNIKKRLTPSRAYVDRLKKEFEENNKGGGKCGRYSSSRTQKRRRFRSDKQLRVSYKVAGGDFHSIKQRGNAHVVHKTGGGDFGTTTRRFRCGICKKWFEARKVSTLGYLVCPFCTHKYENTYWRLVRGIG